MYNNEIIDSCGWSGSYKWRYMQYLAHAVTVTNDGTIKFESVPFKHNEKNNFFKLPILRAVGLYEAIIGYGLTGQQVSEEDKDKKTNPLIKSLMNLLAIIFAISHYVFANFCWIPVSYILLIL